MTVIIILFAIHSTWALGQHYAEDFHALTLALLQSGNGNMTAQVIRVIPTAQIHLLRIPKASSSSLSVVARRIVGCEPPGPCCKWPGDPPGSCPAKGLFACQTEGRVIGCTHHYPNYDALRSPTVVSISIMREPWRRAISAFFYPGIHHNSKCTAGLEACFREYALSTKWRNVAVKMLTGSYAYEDRAACRHSSPVCQNSLEAALRNLHHLAFIGVAEMWELSMCLLHIKMPQLSPMLSEFKLAEKNAGGTTGAPVTPASIAAKAGGNRINAGESYQLFKTRALVDPKIQDLLASQSEFDTILYQEILSRLCDDLHKYRLWQHPLVRTYWREKNVGQNLTRCPM